MGAGGGEALGERSPLLISALPGETTVAERKTAGSHARRCCCSRGENVRGREASVSTVTVGPSRCGDPDHLGWWGVTGLKQIAKE